MSKRRNKSSIVSRKQQRYGRYIDKKNYAENLSWFINILEKIEEEIQDLKEEAERRFQFQEDWFGLEEEHPDSFSNT